MKKILGLTIIALCTLFVVACNSEQLQENPVSSDHNANGPIQEEVYGDITVEDIISILESREMPIDGVIYVHPTPRLLEAMPSLGQRLRMQGGYDTKEFRFYSYITNIENVRIDNETNRVYWTATIDTPYYHIISLEPLAFISSISRFNNDSLWNLGPRIDPRPIIEPTYDFDAELAINNMLKNGVDIIFFFANIGLHERHSLNINESNVSNIEIIFIHRGSTFQYYVDAYVFLEDGVKVQIRFLFDYLPDSNIDSREWWRFTQTSEFDSATNAFTGPNRAFRE